MAYKLLILLIPLRNTLSKIENPHFKDRGSPGKRCFFLFTALFINLWALSAFADDAKQINRLDSCIVSNEKGNKLEKTEYSYSDETGKLNQSREFEWNKINNTWLKCAYTDYYYGQDDTRANYTRYVGIEYNGYSYTQWIGYPSLDPVVIENEDGGKTISKLTYEFVPDRMYYRAIHKELSTYDNNGNLTSRESYYYESKYSAWFGTNKSDYEYTASGKLQKATDYYYYYGWNPESEVRYIYDAQQKLVESKNYSYEKNDTNDWKLSRRAFYSYDENGKLLLSETFAEDAVNQEQIPHSKSIHTYNTEGLKTRRHDLSYSQKDNLWVNALELMYEYDGNGNSTYYQQSAWDTSAGAWKPIEKSVREYDAERRIVLDENYSWSYTNTWTGSGKNVYGYDHNGNRILNETYVWKNSAWTGSTKQVNSYDENRNMTLDERYNWDSSEKTWKGSKKETYEFDEQGNKILDIKYQWNNNKEWIESRKQIMQYDEHNQNTQILEYAWDESNNIWAWDATKNLTYYYSKIYVGNSGIRINNKSPVTFWIDHGILYTDHPESVTSIKIYSIEGHCIGLFSDFPVPVSSLPNGTYVIHAIYKESRQISRKILIK